LGNNAPYASILTTTGPDHITCDVGNASERSHEAGIYRQTVVEYYPESRVPIQICLGDKVLALSNHTLSKKLKRIEIRTLASSNYATCPRHRCVLNDVFHL
jgi:hypothetical protein